MAKRVPAPPRAIRPSSERSAIMRAVKSRDTTPEIVVRRFLHRRGRRFRLCADDLPGRPDVVMPARRCVVFVNGCFWHGHDCPRGARIPVTNRCYWTQKIARNMERDRNAAAKLRGLGWHVVVIWECETRDQATLGRALASALRRKRR